MEDEDVKDLQTTDDTAPATVNPQQQMMQMQAKELEQMNQIATEVMSDVNDDRDKSDELYDYMKDLIDLEADKSDATRQMMGKAVEQKVEATKQKIELLKIKAKLLNPSKGNGTNVNINLGEFDQKKGADTNGMIDITEKLREEFH